MALVKLGIVFAVLIAAYGVYRPENPQPRDGKVWGAAGAVLWPDGQALSRTCRSAKNEMVRLLNAAVSRGQRDDAPRRNIPCRLTASR
ncbi:hypothetical protein MJ561_05745 [Klebsiella pneumoniae]|nr:hypothetical protein MJ561_05745 [Klebsiella pneumoniae]